MHQWVVLLVSVVQWRTFSAWTPDLRLTVLKFPLSPSCPNLHPSLSLLCKVTAVIKKEGFKKELRQCPRHTLAFYMSPSGTFWLAATTPTRMKPAGGRMKINRFHRPLVRRYPKIETKLKTTFHVLHWKGAINLTFKCFLHLCNDISKADHTDH